MIYHVLEAAHGVETASKRGKRVEKQCATCGAGIGLNRTWCAPCSDDQERARKKKYRQKRLGDRTESPTARA